MNVRHFLRKYCGLTARSMTILKYDGSIIRRGEVLRSCDPVHAGDVIELHLPEDSNEIEPVQGILDVLYEDEYLLVVKKPPFMPVHPTKVHQQDTLANIVSYDQEQKGERYTFRALNRLDKDTSGCIVIAKDRLTYALTQSGIKKRYIAVCEGILTEGGTITSPIALEEGSRIRRCVSPKGQYAVTHYDPIASGGGHTLVELNLETGRTHQIRCHMSSIGHPLAGDDLYGGSRSLIGRQALHCRDVSLIHPFLHEVIDLHAELPEDMKMLLHRCHTKFK